MVVVSVAVGLGGACGSTSGNAGPGAGGANAGAGGGKAGAGGSTAGAGGNASGGSSAGMGGNGGAGGERNPTCLPKSAGCCYLDEDCASTEECVGAECGLLAPGAPPVAIPGACKTRFASGSTQCWQASDCAKGCTGAQVCGCANACLVADMPGTCNL